MIKCAGYVVVVQDGKVKMHTKVYSENLKRLRCMWSHHIKISLEYLWCEVVDIIHLAHRFAMSI